MADPVWRWPGSDDLTVRAGQCYTLAMEAVLANPRLADRLWLVHGVLHPERSEQADSLAARPEGLPPANPHAWLELTADDGELGLDPVLRYAEELGVFRARFGCETTRRYRADVAVSIALRRDDYGPWDARSLALWRERKRLAAEHPQWSTERVVARYLAGAG